MTCPSPVRVLVINHEARLPPLGRSHGLDTAQHLVADQRDLLPHKGRLADKAGATQQSPAKQGVLVTAEGDGGLALRGRLRHRFGCRGSGCRHSRYRHQRRGRGRRHSGEVKFGRDGSAGRIGWRARPDENDGGRRHSCDEHLHELEGPDDRNDESERKRQQAED